MKIIFAEKLANKNCLRQKIGYFFYVIHRSQSPIFCFQIKIARVDGAYTGK